MGDPGLYDLEVAAGRFSEPQTVAGVPQVGEVTNPDDYTWVAPGGHTQPARGLFVAKVVGESMNRRIPNGAWCLWQLDPGCDGRSGAEVVLARHAAIQDEGFGAGYTVKLYERLVEELDDGSCRTTKVLLRPDSNDPSFQPLVLEGLAEGELVIVARMVEVVG